MQHINKNTNGERQHSPVKYAPHKLDLFKYKRSYATKNNNTDNTREDTIAKDHISKSNAMLVDGYVDKRSSDYVHNHANYTQDIFYKEKGMRELKELRNEIRHNTMSYKRAWIHFWCMLLEVVYILIRLVRDVIYSILKIIALILLFVIKIVATILLALYFFIIMWLPTRRSSPFRNPNLYEGMRNRHHTVRRQRVLFLDLDNTLVSITSHKPVEANYARLKVKAAGDEAFEVYYCVKRPYLDEFLEEVI